MRELEKLQNMSQRTYLFHGDAVKIFYANQEGEQIKVVTDKKVITRNVNEVSALIREFLPMASTEDDQTINHKVASGTEAVIKSKVLDNQSYRVLEILGIEKQPEMLMQASLQDEASIEKMKNVFSASKIDNAFSPEGKGSDEIIARCIVEKSY